MEDPLVDEIATGNNPKEPLDKRIINGR